MVGTAITSTAKGAKRAYKSSTAWTLVDKATSVGLRLFPTTSTIRKLGAKVLNYQGTNLRGLAYFTTRIGKSTDNVLDVLIHSDGANYKIFTEKTGGGLLERTVTPQELAEIFSDLPNPPATIRLLSCSDLASAQALSKAIPDRKIHAVEDIVRIHEDGGISTVARSSNTPKPQWKEIQDGNILGNAPTPIAPTGSAVGKFVRLGSSTKVTGTPSTIDHEINQAEIIGDYLGGGEFQFIDSKQGIEGFLQNGTDEIPISLKEYTTDNMKNIFRRIKDNADKIETESRVDPKIIIGSSPNSIIYAESTVFTEQQILSHIANNSDNILPPKNIFSKVILKSVDNKFILIPLK